MLCHLLTES